MDWLAEMVLPDSDVVVMVQAVTVVAVFGLMLWKTWSVLERRLITIGSGLVVLGLMGVRALH